MQKLLHLTRPGQAVVRFPQYGLRLFVIHDGYCRSP